MDAGAVQCGGLASILPEMQAPRPPSDLQDSAPDSAGAAARARHPIAPRQYLWIAGAVVVFASALHWLGPVLTPFLIGAILAYLGNPIVVRCARAGVSRTFGTLIAVVVMSLATAALLLVIVPLVQAELTMLFRRLPDLANFFSTHVAPRLNEYLGISVQFDLATLRELASENIESVRELGARLLSGMRTGGLVLLSVVVNLALVPVVMFYLLRDWHLIVARIDELVPRRWLPLVRGMATDIDHVLAEFLHGQSLVMLTLAAYYVVALSVVGLKFALPIGILTGLLVFIPYVGFGLGFVLGVLAALLQWSGWPGFARRTGRLRRRAAGRELRADPVPRRRPHRPAPVGGDLRAARVRAAVRLRRRAARAAGVGRAARRAAAPARCVRRVADLSRVVSGMCPSS